IILCIALLCGTAWLTRSKLVIYVGGLLIYVLYIIASIFSNSPLMAGSAPSTPEAMSLFAKLDPLGMAAFFEQTKYWTAHERNTLQLSLSGNFLFNRVLWMSIAALVLGLSYARFSFRKLNSKPAKIKKGKKDIAESYTYKPVTTQVHTVKHNFASLLSFLKIDVVSIVKGIPFLLVIILWTALLGIEMMNSIEGDPRIGERYATTGIMISTIMDVLPFFSLLVILFYSSETVRVHDLESTTPVHPKTVFLSKLASLAVIPLFLIAYSCVIGMIVQSGNIGIGLYLSLFYYIGLPLVLCAVLIVFIQSKIKNKYAGLAVATVVILLTSTNIGIMAGIRHPLLRYANVLNVKYEDMNGFGAYATAFHWQMLCWTALALCMIGYARKLMFIVFLGAAWYISYPQKDVNEWKYGYENNYKKYQHLPQPTITSVKATIDLYPNRYTVSGEYQLVNKTSTAIDSLLLYIDQNSKLKAATIQNATLKKDEPGFGHYWYVMNKKLQPGDSIRMQFSFTSGWSPFKGHTAFNSIIDNGSFMRISNYFPSFGYEDGNEITSKIEREKRHMRPQDELKKLEAPLDSPYNY
ncbi:MAG TPA: hypothetical protein VEB42_03415, partial [Chitinophagaceae bacterium]|nr:hypothetical protein [Chitinophagaceae bacterium]